MRRLIIGATRNWSRNVLLWNLAADPKNNPHTDNGGCGMCHGAITIDGDQVSRNLAYYAVAHASKFVRPGAVRIASTSPEALPYVAFRHARPDRSQRESNTADLRHPRGEANDRDPRCGRCRDVRLVGQSYSFSRISFVGLNPIPS